MNKFKILDKPNSEVFSKSSSRKSVDKSRSDAASVPLTPKFNKEESKDNHPLDNHWPAPASVANSDVLLSSLESQNLERSRDSSNILFKEEEEKSERSRSSTS